MDSRRSGRVCEILRGVVLLVCLTAALVLPGSASASAPDVAALQVALRIGGTYSGGIDGIFGPETQAAVRRFQRSEQLIVDGDPGPRTRAAFGRFARHRLGTRPLRRGRSGWDVAALQYLLVRCGFSVGAIDGFFGPLTRTVVVRYQHRAGLFVDGVAGAATTGGLRRALGCPELKGTVPSGVTVSGVGIGGLSAHWASIALRSVFAEPLHLVARGRGWLVDPNQFARAEVATAVRRALHARAGKDIPLRVAVQRRRIRRYAARIDSRLCRPPVPARLVGLRSLRPSISRAHAGCHVRPVRFIRALIPLERSVIRVPMKRVRPAVTRANFGPVIVIHRNSHRLYLYRGVRLVRALTVSTGRRSSPTPLGRFRIVTKARRPWWYPPASAWANRAQPMPPGPGNPLGTRWMGISAPEVGIHGTPDAASVGYSRSHGCVRMYRREAEWLFRRVRIGTPVIIVPF
jgi:hypothetical protein